jgi:hypothetical protein
LMRAGGPGIVVSAVPSGLGPDSCAEDNGRYSWLWGWQETFLP